MTDGNFFALPFVSPLSLRAAMSLNRELLTVQSVAAAATDPADRSLRQRRRNNIISVRTHVHVMRAVAYAWRGVAAVVDLARKGRVLRYRSTRIIDVLLMLDAAAALHDDDEVGELSVDREDERS